MNKNYLLALNTEIYTLNSALAKIPSDNGASFQISTKQSQSIMKLTSNFNSPVALQDPKDLRPPIRKVLSEQRARKCLLNPSSNFDIDVIKKKYSIPSVISMKSRQLGNTAYFRPKPVRHSKAVVLPKQFRENPLAEPPPITEKDVDSGVMSLIHRGLIPKDVDLTPAFERGFPPLQMKTAQFHDWRDMAPPPPPGIITNFLPLEKLSLPQEISVIPPTVPNQSKVVALVKEVKKNSDEIIENCSTHQIILRKGKLVLNKEFQSFKKINSEHWGAVAQALMYAEEIFTRLATPLVYINGKKLAKRVKDELKPIKLDDLLECVMNLTTINPAISNPDKKFKQPLGKKMAAVKIQSTWKCFKAYTAYKQLKILIRKSILIQGCLRNWRRKTRTQQIIKNQEEVLFKAHRAIQQRFESDFSAYKNHHRLEIHIFNTEEDMQSLHNPEVFQSTQISRLYSVKNPLIDIIMIISKILTEEIKNYYYRILEIGGIANPQARVTFIHPDILNKHTLAKRTSSLLYFSNKTLSNLKKITYGKRAYIVPSKLNIFDIKISVFLDLPILSGTFEESFKYSSRSEVRSIFQQCEIPIPYSEANIFNEKALCQKLALLIMHYSEVELWIFKLNREDNSRGIAYIETESVKMIADARKVYDLRQACELQDLISELKSTLPSLVKFIMPTLYKNWGHFLQKVQKYGMLIQSAPVTPKSRISNPSVSFLIDPDGQTNYVASADLIHSSDYLDAGGFFPQTSIPHEDLIEIINKLSRALYNKRLYGHFNLQLSVFSNPSETSRPIVWAIDLSFGLSKLACNYLYFHFLLGGSMDVTTGKYYIRAVDSEDEAPEENPKMGDTNIYHLKNSPRKIETDRLFCKIPLKITGADPVYQDPNSYDIREFFACWDMYHPDLLMLDIKTFFHMCRYEGVSYDLEHGKGITFIIYDLMKYGYIGAMSVGNRMEELVAGINKALGFLVQHVGPPPLVSEEYCGKEYRSMSELIARMKNIERQIKKSKGKRRTVEII